MPRPRVYVETTIPNFYYDFRPSEAVALRREATRRWWATAAERYELVTSVYVHDELSAGRGAAVALRLKLLEGIGLLRASPAVDATIEVYFKHRLMPRKPPVDAMHLALASHYGCDLIVTWNCKHLANKNKVHHIQRINTSLGLGLPRLVTPLELVEGGFR
jgi:predicted nucleic acid-binding protein